MHDVFEGVAIVEIKCMLEELIKNKKLFTLPYLNERIRLFPFGYSDVTSKPHPLPATLFTTAKALKQSCKVLSITSILCIHYILSFSFSDMVPFKVAAYDYWR